jgi:hypothetical protein
MIWVIVVLGVIAALAVMNNSLEEDLTARGDAGTCAGITFPLDPYDRRFDLHKRACEDYRVPNRGLWN